MPVLTAVVLLHEYILKVFLPRYKLKAEALEASRHLVDSLLYTMAQEQVKRNDTESLTWDTANNLIKYDISALGTIKIERKNGELFLVIQDGNARVRIHKDTFLKLYQFKESIEYLMSFLEANAICVHHGQGLDEQ